MKQAEAESLTGEIYSYLKDWLNPQGTMVPMFVYGEILKIIQAHGQTATEKLKAKNKA